MKAAEKTCRLEQMHVLYENVKRSDKNLTARLKKLLLATISYTVRLGIKYLVT